MLVGTVTAAAGGSLAAPPRPLSVEEASTLVGTDSSPEASLGNTYPAAVWPFGMVAWTHGADRTGARSPPPRVVVVGTTTRERKRP